jgi:hypothetical protein
VDITDKFQKIGVGFTKEGLITDLPPHQSLLVLTPISLNSQKKGAYVGM